MVRVAVRVITLSIFKVEEPAIRKHLLHTAVVPYFANLVWFVRRQVKVIDDRRELAKFLTLPYHHLTNFFRSGEKSTVDVYLDEIQDVLSYFQDIMNLGYEELASSLVHYAVMCFSIPQLATSLRDVFLPSVFSFSAPQNYFLYRRIPFTLQLHYFYLRTYSKLLNMSLFWTPWSNLSSTLVLAYFLLIHHWPPAWKFLLPHHQLTKCLNSQ